MGPELLGQAAGVGHLPGLGGGIDCTLGVAPEGGDRADRDDPAPVALDHPLCHRAADQDRGQQVAIEHRFDVLLLDHHGVVGVGLATFCGDVATGVVDQDVDRTQSFSHLVHDPIDLFPVGQVGQDFQGFDPAVLTDFPGRVAQRGPFAVFAGTLLTHPVHTHPGSSRGQVFGKGPAESTAGSGDQSHLSLEKSRHGQVCYFFAEGSGSVRTVLGLTPSSIRLASTGPCAVIVTQTKWSNLPSFTPLRDEPPPVVASM